MKNSQNMAGRLRSGSRNFHARSREQRWDVGAGEAIRNNGDPICSDRPDPDCDLQRVMIARQSFLSHVSSLKDIRPPAWKCQRKGEHWHGDSFSFQQQSTHKKQGVLLMSSRLR